MPQAQGNNDKVTDAMDNQPPQPPPPTTAADEGGSLAVDNTASIKKNDNDLLKNEEVVPHHNHDNNNNDMNINIKSSQPHQLLDQGSVSATAAAASTANAMSRSDSKLGSLKDDDDITSVSLYL